MADFNMPIQRALTRWLMILALGSWLPVSLAFSSQPAVTAVNADKQDSPAADQQGALFDTPHYNRLLRTQLANLWSYVESTVISRTVWRAVTRPADGPVLTGVPGVRAEVTSLHTAANTAADKLISVLTQINAQLRSNPHGKHFLITHKTFTDLAAFVRDSAIVDGLSQDKESTLISLINRIEDKAGISMSKIIADETSATASQRQGAISVKPFSQPDRNVNNGKGLLQRARARSDHAHDGQTIATRMERAQTYTNWQDQLLRQTLAGAMVGAGLEAVITLTYKTIYERPPWAWEDADTVEVAKAAATGALTGAVSTAATWTVQNYYPGVPLWAASTLVTGSMHLLKESLKMAASHKDAPSTRELAESLPATIVMSLAACLGEQISPVPLLGAIAGALTGRMAMSLVHQHLYRPSTLSRYSALISRDARVQGSQDIGQQEFTFQQPVLNNPIPSHIAVGVISPNTAPVN